MPVVSGTAQVLGHDLRRDRRSVRRQVGLLGHATMLYDELTVADNVRFWTRAPGADPADAEAAVEALGLGGRLRHVAVARLSAGQRRRAAIAVLVARRPEIWLLDEPHAGLDQDGRDLVDGLIGEASKVGVTVLIASHELERSHALAGRVGHHHRRSSHRGHPPRSPPTPPTRAAGRRRVDVADQEVTGVP